MDIPWQVKCHPKSSEAILHIAGNRKLATEGGPYVNKRNAGVPDIV